MRAFTTTAVAQLTGPGSVNATDVRWNVHGTDLGHPLLHRGQLYLVFGDTWGADGVEGRQWRSNVMARVADPDPAAGMRFATMLEDDRGWARELLPSRKRWPEKTVIPTFGVSVDGRMYLHHMSVRRWQRAGRWRINHSALAYSDDDGRTWSIDRRTRWSGHSRFGQVAFVSHQAHVYVFGISAGRFGAATLARVPGGDLLRPDRYEFWDGARWRGEEAAATPVVPPPVGELSVRWSDRHGRWLMLHLDESRAAIVLRTASDLTGPWSEGVPVATADEYPQLYAPYLLPASSIDPDGIHFTMSRFGPYNVFLMRTEAHGGGDG